MSRVGIVMGHVDWTDVKKKPVLVDRVMVLCLLAYVRHNGSSHYVHLAGKADKAARGLRGPLISLLQFA